jgi:hypothetical protein
MRACLRRLKCALHVAKVNQDNGDRRLVAYQQRSLANGACLLGPYAE